MEHLFSNRQLAESHAQHTANVNGAPVAILTRDFWLRICEEPPDDMEPSPFENGWTMVAFVEPKDTI